MRRWVAYFGTLGVMSLVFLLLPLEVTHAAIVPQCPTDGCRACDLVTLANNVMKFLLMISVFVAALLLAIAGLRSVVKGENAELTNTAINIFLGIVIMLVGWLVVDTIMRVLTGSRLGPWNTIECKSNTPLVKFAEKPTGSVSVVPGGSKEVYGTPDSLPDGTPRDPSTQTPQTTGERGSKLCDSGTGASPQELQSLGLSASEASAMSCIAYTENGCQVVGYSGTGPCGMFQISGENRRAFGAAGCTDQQICTNMECNRQTAINFFNSRGYQPWTGANANGPWNRAARTCVNNYDSGTSRFTGM